MYGLHIVVYGPLLFFFFQAEDGIRDRDVTGVQTCALPISSMWPASMSRGAPWGLSAAMELPCTSAFTSSAKALNSSRQTRAGAVSKPEGPGVSSSRFRNSSVVFVMGGRRWKEGYE